MSLLLAILVLGTPCLPFPAAGFVLGKPTYGEPQVLTLKAETRAELAKKLAEGAAAGSEDGDSAVHALQVGRAGGRACGLWGDAPTHTETC